MPLKTSVLEKKFNVLNIGGQGNFQGVSVTIYKLPKNTGYPENVIMIKYHLAIISYKDKKSQYDINLEVKLVLPKEVILILETQLRNKINLETSLSS